MNATTEQTAREEVLRLCRKTGIGGWVMRKGVRNKFVQQKPCMVFNRSPYTVKPYGWDVVAEGETWTEVLDKINGRVSR